VWDLGKSLIKAVLQYAAGIGYEPKVAIGDPSVEIVTIAKKENADLIIIGSRGLGALKGILLGNVSQKIAQVAPCPVMIVNNL